MLGYDYHEVSKLVRARLRELARILLRVIVLMSRTELNN